MIKCFRMGTRAATDNNTIILVSHAMASPHILNSILNAIPSVCIRGENYNFGLALYSCYKNNFKKWLAASSPQSMLPSDPFYGAYLLDENVFLADLRHLFLKQLYPDGMKTKTIGFCETRYTDIDLKGDYQKVFSGLLDFYRKIFKNVKFIFHTCSHEQAAIPERWAKNPQAMELALEQFDTVALFYSSRAPHLCYHTTSLDLLAYGDVLKGLMSFLGVEFTQAMFDDAIAGISAPLP